MDFFFCFVLTAAVMLVSSLSLSLKNNNIFVSENVYKYLQKK